MGEGDVGSKKLIFVLLIYAYPENLAQIRLLVSKLVKGVEVALGENWRRKEGGGG